MSRRMLKEDWKTLGWRDNGHTYIAISKGTQMHINLAIINAQRQVRPGTVMHLQTTTRNQRESKNGIIARRRERAMV